MAKIKEVRIKDEYGDDDDGSEDAVAPGESTPLLVSAGRSSDPTSSSAFEREQLFQSFRRQRSVARLSLRASSAVGVSAEDRSDLLTLDVAHPIDALAPLVPGGIAKYYDREFVPYRQASLVKSVPAFAPYTRKARHRSFYLWWLNEFRHWWKSSRLLVRLGGLYVYSFDPMVAPIILILDPEKHKTIKKLCKFAKTLGQGGPMRDFVKTVKPFTRSMRIVVGGWRWVEAAPCRRGEVGVEEFMAFVGNRVSRMIARTVTDMTAADAIFPIQRYLFRQDLLPYPDAYHPISVCVAIGIVRAVSPFAASFQGSRVGRVLTRRFFASSKNRWLPVQRIGDLNLNSDDCQEKDEVDQTADLVIIARIVAKALGEVQVSSDGNGNGGDVVKQQEALLKEGFQQVGAGSGGYAVYQYHFKQHILLLHVTPYGPSITDIMPYYTVLEFETSCDRRNQWSEFVSKSIWSGPPVVEGYCYQGAFFSPHHFAELKAMYDKQLLTYEAACKKLPIVSKTTRHGGPPRDLPTLKKFLETGKRGRKRNQNIREYNSLQKVVTSVAKEILSAIKKEKEVGSLAPKGVILYFEGLDCSGKSSTGGLVQTALEQAGYAVGMRQYNRPPTAEQRLRPWMDRFDTPGEANGLDLTPNADDGNKKDDRVHIGLVWDRGPGGDFVYGNLND
mmetsp:Transcript_1008/g.2335  ORF Transcript_1008/g.2335 Transcript_1008/m.2335 type:complete len:672 (-) Transcript_1008:914-2929(-)